MVKPVVSKSTQSGLAAACRGSVFAILIISMNAAASHTEQPRSVAVVGDLQAVLGCPDNWQPDCAATELASADGLIWAATFDLPAGDFQYKIALNDSWEENYGVHGLGGTNILLSLAAPASVTFTYDHETHAISGNAPGVESGVDPSSLVVATPELRDEILERAKKDQDARLAAIAWDREHGEAGHVDEALLDDSDRAVRQELWGRVEEIDASNTEWLKAVVNDRGWPGYSDVGVEAGNAAWLLVQHADADHAFQRRCLDLMQRLPPSEMSQQSLAYLTDRVLVAEGKNQVYGTQLVARDGTWVPAPLEDEDNVDRRRAEAGLPPIAEYLEMHEKFARGELD